MGKLYDEITPQLADWIRAQPLFFVGTAPRDNGRVNVSPKGPIDTLRIVDSRTIEYDDHVGSGAETIAHVRENGRICVMLCAFEGPPKIVRLHGRGEVLRCDDPGDGTRSIVRVHVERISDSCGYGCRSWSTPGSGRSAGFGSSARGGTASSRTCGSGTPRASMD